MESYHNPSEIPPYEQTIIQVPETTAMDIVPPVKTRKRKAPTLRIEDWEPYRTQVIELHVR